MFEIRISFVALTYNLSPHALFPHVHTQGSRHPFLLCYTIVMIFQAHQAENPGADWSEDDLTHDQNLMYRIKRRNLWK